MTDKEIQEGNRLIAEFMEWEKEGAFYFAWGEQVDRVLTSEMIFHSSWDWLMPVIENIQEFKVWNEDKKDLKLISNISINLSFDGYSHRHHCIITGSITHCYTDKIPHNFKKVEFPQISIIDKSNIRAVWLAVVKFIKWYNQNKDHDQNKINQNK